MAHSRSKTMLAVEKWGAKNNSRKQGSKIFRPTSFDRLSSWFFLKRRGAEKRRSLWAFCLCGLRASVFPNSWKGRNGKTSIYRYVFIAFDLANSRKNDKSVRWTPRSDRVSLDWPWIRDAPHRGLYLPQWYGLVPSNVTAGLPHRPRP